MAEAERKPDNAEQTLGGRPTVGALGGRAVAIDPPPAGAIGIQELLSRFESFAEADEFLHPPQDGAVGVRELLARLGNLADAGYFASSEAESSKRK